MEKGTEFRPEAGVQAWHKWIVSTGSRDTKTSRSRQVWSLKVSADLIFSNLTQILTQRKQTKRCRAQHGH